MLNKDKKQTKNRKSTQKSKEFTPLQINLFVNPTTGTVDVLPNANISLMTARGMVEEARDNLASINRDNWRHGKILRRQAMNRRHKKESNWNKKEKERLHHANHNK